MKQYSWYSAAVLMSLLAVYASGCSQKPTFILTANRGQIGQGSQITLQEGAGTITIVPTPSWPAGLNERVAGDSERAFEELNGGRMWSAHIPSKKLTLTFISVGNVYVCQSCVGLQLPLEWSRKAQ